MNCYVEHMTFVGNQPAAEKAEYRAVARGFSASVFRNRDDHPRKLQSQLSLERSKAPWRGKREPLDLEDSGQVTKFGVPYLDRHQTKSLLLPEPSYGYGRAAPTANAVVASESSRRSE